MSDCGPRTGAVLKRFVSALARNLSLSLSLSLWQKPALLQCVCELGVCGCAWASVCGAEIWRKQPFWRHGNSS